MSNSITVTEIIIEDPTGKYESAKISIAERADVGTGIKRGHLSIENTDPNNKGVYYENLLTLRQK